MTEKGRAMRRLAIVAMAPLALATACSRPAPAGNNGSANAVAAPAPAPAAADTAAPLVPPTPAPTSTPATAPDPVARVEKSDLLDYTYKYPAEAAAIPALKTLLDRRADEAKARALADAREDQQATTKIGSPFHAHYYEAAWLLAADTPRFLSLVGSIGAYTGGAHGMVVYTPLLWDKQAGKQIAVADLFTSHAAVEAAIRSDFCDSLDQQRATKRGAPVKRSDQPFEDCIDPMKEALVPTAGATGAIDGFTVYVAPYDAGPYAEGDYQIAVPVSAALMRAIKPAYRSAFTPAS